MSSTYVIGWEGYAADTSLLADPQAPKNWKDQKKIDAYIADKIQERDSQASLIPWVGQVKSLVVLDGMEGDVVFRQHRMDEPEIAKNAVEMFLDLDVPTDCGTESGDFSLADGPTIYGFNAKPLFRMLAMEVFRIQQDTTKPDVEIPPRFWYHTPGVFDPFEMAVQSAMRNEMDLPTICDALGIVCNCDDAWNRAQTAHALCRRLQLI